MERRLSSSPPPAKTPRTRQLTLEESMAAQVPATSSTDKPLQNTKSYTPPLFSDSESDHCSTTADDDDLHTQTLSTLSFPSSPTSTPPHTPCGVPLSDISFGPSCAPVLPPLASSPTHTVMFQPTLHNPRLLSPKLSPNKFRDVWDGNHVRSPCSPQSLYPVKTDTGETKLLSRWALIKASLSKPIGNSYDLEEAIMEYNTRQANKWSFGALHAYFTEVATDEESSAFFTSLLPKIITLALQLPDIVTHGMPLLRKQETYSVTISQQQSACLLANAFFCTFPRRNAVHRSAEFFSYPTINFNSLFSGRRVYISPVRAAKFKCIFHYFTRVTSSVPTRVLTFTRQVCAEPPQWDKCSAKLTKLHITSEATIEEGGQGMLQVDFANRYVGGGVLSSGSVQEEIRFLICPDLILSRLFTQELEDNECLIMKGAEQFSSYSGYGSTFDWAGSHTDSTVHDAWGRRETCIVAMDALVVRSSTTQFKPGLIQREVNKAYCSFMTSDPTPSGRPTAVATGNWGCGAFGGDKRLKALIQWLAASAAGRDVVYFTFGDTGLQKDLHILQEQLDGHGVSVSDVWRVMLTYHRQSPRPPLYKYILEQLCVVST